MMRCILLSAMMLLIPSVTHSQSNKVPPFKITQADGKVFFAGNLPLGKPIVIIYFSPECEDCQQLIKGLINRINELKNVSIAMITSQPKEKVKQFISEYQLDKYSNIFIGTEEDSYFVGKYYKVGQLPFMALYNKNGDLIKIYDKELSIADLLIRLKDL
jgi:cytochrome oxidase Cu insertion factor (SCO1/SenC/PrrC family)